jgi:hypothetical protein
LPPDALARAALLVGAVHDHGPAEVDQILRRCTHHDLLALSVTLAALVPCEYSVSELLAWNDCQWERPPLDVVPDPKELQPHGTHAAFNRHRKAGDEPCDPCWCGERRYQRERKRRGRALQLVGEGQQAMA